MSQLLHHRGLVLDFICIYFSLICRIKMKRELIYFRKWATTLLPWCSDTGWAGEIKWIRAEKKKKDVFRGGGGSMSVSGAADRSVPIPVGAGGRSSVVVHSKAILCLQKPWNVQSPLRLYIPVLMSAKCSFTLRQHTLCNYVNLSRNYPRFIAAGPKSFWGQRKPKLWWDPSLYKFKLRTWT